MAQNSGYRRNGTTAATPEYRNAIPPSSEGAAPLIGPSYELSVIYFQDVKTTLRLTAHYHALTLSLLVAMQSE